MPDSSGDDVRPLFRRGAPFVLGGLALTCLAGSWWTAGRIEDDVRTRVVAALPAVSAAQVAVSGRDVSITGNDPIAIERAAEAVRTIDGVRSVDTTILTVAGEQPGVSVTPRSSSSPSATLSTAPGASAPSADAGATPAASATPSTRPTRRVVLVRRVGFDTSSADLDTDDMAVLDAAATFLRQHSTATVSVTGNSDDRGRPNVKSAISRARAKVVKEYLVAHGVDPSRISTSGQSDAVPLVRDTTDSGRALNRRADITIEDS